MSDLPTIIIFLIFITVIPILSVIIMYIFKSMHLDILRCSENSNGLFGIFLGLSSIFLGVLVSFLVVTTWNIKKSTSLNSQQEAQSIYILYQNIAALPDTEHIKILIEKYLEYIIKVEYPQLKNGTVSEFGSEILSNLQKSVYDYKPTTENGSVYSNAVQQLNIILGLRVDRIHNSTSGLSWILWLVCILNTAIIILVSIFLNCDSIIHYILVYIIGIFIGGMLFLIYEFEYPFKGANGLTSQPFQEALNAVLHYHDLPTG